MERLYCGIDLHANNAVISVIDQEGRCRHSERVRTDLELIARRLSPYRKVLQSVAVESTFNWYWLVDGLAERGYQMKLVNTGAVRQYDGLKHSDDKDDARLLAELQRLGILPEGYIYPKEERALRDLLRKRMRLVQEATRHLLSSQSQVYRHSGSRMTASQLRKLEVEEIPSVVGPDGYVSRAMEANLRVLECLDKQVAELEKITLRAIKDRVEFQMMKTMPGVGNILAMVIALESGSMDRFPHVGKYASYCRCVQSGRWSNNKKKGSGNVRNGNRYLSWAFVEAAHGAIRFSPPVKSFFERKKKRTHHVVALKAVAHKLARAAFYMMRDHQPFELERAF